MRPLDPIRVLVIDDSAFSRQTIARLLERSPRVEVVGVARDGQEALRKTFELEPDLVTLDLEMPRMDGFTYLRLVMSRRPTPVMVISGRAEQSDVFRALELGAVDVIAKPSDQAGPELAQIEHELLRKVHAVRDLRIDRVSRRLVAAAPAHSLHAGAGAPRVVAIGSSTGGPAALMEIFGAFAEPPHCAFLVAQHMPRDFTRGFAERLNRSTVFRAREARGGETLEPGQLLLAPGGAHLELEIRDGVPRARVEAAGERDRYVPSVDRLFESAAKHCGPDLLAVVLTGMGDDGSRGVAAVRQGGGQAIAESEATAVVFGMPRQAIRTGCIDRVLPLGQLAAAIGRGVTGPVGPAEGDES